MCFARAFFWCCCFGVRPCWCLHPCLVSLPISRRNRCPIRGFLVFCARFFSPFSFALRCSFPAAIKLTPQVGALFDEWQARTGALLDARFAEMAQGVAQPAVTVPAVDATPWYHHEFVQRTALACVRKLGILSPFGKPVRVLKLLQQLPRCSNATMHCFLRAR